MMLSTLLYASTSCLPADGRETGLASLVAEAVSNNLRLGMTGALMRCGTRFVQILEGPSAPLRQLVDSIGADPRHTDMVVLLQSPILDRRFARFTMAYDGQSLFVSRNIAKPVAQAKRGSVPVIDDLIQLMLEFSR